MAVVASDYRPVTRKLEKYASVPMRAQSAILHDREGPERTKHVEAHASNMADASPEAWIMLPLA
jgi:hypothetical protein